MPRYSFISLSSSGGGEEEEDLQSVETVFTPDSRLTRHLSTYRISLRWHTG